MLADFLLQCRCAQLELFLPANQLAILPAPFTLLLQLFRELGQFALTATIQRPQLIEDDDRMNPLRINQQALQVFEFLRFPCSRTLLFLDPLLQTMLLLAKLRKLFFKFRTVLEEFDELLVLVSLLVCSTENRCTACHIGSLNIIPAAE